MAVFGAPTVRVPRAVWERLPKAALRRRSKSGRRQGFLSSEGRRALWIFVAHTVREHLFVPDR
jgi:hypothetical protein